MNKHLRPANLEHTCHCRACSPDLFAGLPEDDKRIDGNHFAPKFGHHGPGWRITVSGMEVPDAIEAYEGDDGWVLAAHRGPYYLKGQKPGEMVRHHGRHPCVPCAMTRMEMRGEHIDWPAIGEPPIDLCKVLMRGRVVVMKPMVTMWRLS
jgi:hypothetical protein